MERVRLASPLLLPAATSLLTAALGVVINLATGAKDSWVAWATVGVLALVVAGGTVLSERSRQPSERAGTRIESWATGSSTEAYGLIARRTVTTSPDGSRTEMIEFYSEEIARRALWDLDD